MRQGLVDFSEPARKIAVRFNEIVQKHSVSASIEMLDAFRYKKSTARLSRSYRGRRLAQAPITITDVPPSGSCADGDSETRSLAGVWH
jgi:hypothetical protein